MTEGECIAIQRCPELLKECKNAPLRLCEAVNVWNYYYYHLTCCYHCILYIERYFIQPYSMLLTLS